MRVPLGVAVLVAALSAPGHLAAQSSIFGVNGLGVPGRPLTGRDAGMGGAFSALDPMGQVNPGALGLWRGLAGWGTGAPGWRSFEGPTTSSSSRATRFPLFGFASQVRPNFMLGVTIGDFLDRNWSVTVQDTLVVRSDTLPYTDFAVSLGGVNELRLGLAYRTSARMALGIGVHAITGSTRQSVQRAFEGDAPYNDFIDVSVTDFRGLAASAGVIAAPTARLQVGASVKLAGSMRAENTAGSTARVALPMQASLGASYIVVPGVSLSSTAQYAGWARAGDDLAAAGLPRPRNTWSVAAGLEVDRASLLVLRTPVRLGYRVRQLPSQVGGVYLSERALSGGIGMSLAQGRTVVEAAFESGSRSAGSLSESFQTLYVGVTVRP